jgi:hypothetical protein
VFRVGDDDADGIHAARGCVLRGVAPVAPTFAPLVSVPAATSLAECHVSRSKSCMSAPQELIKDGTIVNAALAILLA